MGQEVVGYGAAVNDGTGDALHVAFAKLDAGARAFTIIDKDLTAAPPTPAIGDTYIVGAAATGAWATHDGKIAVFGLASTWMFVPPVEGMTAYAQDEDAEYRYSGAAWAAVAAGGTPFELVVAASDETTALTTGTAKVTFHMPSAGTFTEVFIGLSGASSSGVVTADVNKNGTTIFSTNPTIGASQDTSLAGAGSVQAVLSTASFAKGDKMTIDIDAAGTGASGLKVALIGTRT